MTGEITVQGYAEFLAELKAQIRRRQFQALRAVNRELVAQGYAQVSTYPPDVQYVDLYVAAQRDAREKGLGLWGPKPTPKPPSANCHPSYEGVCLTPGIGDYDCAGGSGNGPNYVAGPIRVVGWDEFGLDRDGDGIGCE